MEGYAASGDRSGATLLGSADAGSFAEACRKVYAQRGDFSGYPLTDNLTIWGCRLFDNEVDARRSFG